MDTFRSVGSEQRTSPGCLTLTTRSSLVQNAYTKGTLGSCYELCIIRVTFTSDLIKGDDVGSMVEVMEFGSDRIVVGIGFFRIHGGYFVEFCRDIVLW